MTPFNPGQQRPTQSNPSRPGPIQADSVQPRPTQADPNFLGPCWAGSDSGRPRPTKADLDFLWPRWDSESGRIESLRPATWLVLVGGHDAGVHRQQAPPVSHPGFVFLSRLQSASNPSVHSTVALCALVASLFVNVFSLLFRVHQNLDCLST